MWHEARKQERIIRGMIVDYRRRAERRKDFYEKIKAEPTQFLQLHGRPCKIHLDPTVAAAGEGPAIMMPWQGDPNNMIDRFDVRAHLDFIPDIKSPYIPPEELGQEERHCNYERYRILAQNAFLGISEDKFLQQLAIEEQFGVTLEEKEVQKEKLNEKKGTGAAIGYNYSDPGAQPSCSNGPDNKKVEQKDSDDDSDLEIIDVDLSIDVNKMEASQAHELNAVGPQFGMAGCDLFSFLTGDADDAEHQKQLLREEKEKAMFSGRKSRRERRAHRDKKLSARVSSPPSYAAPRPVERSRSASRSSRSPSPDNTIHFITSFGGDDDNAAAAPPPKPSYVEKLKQNLKKVDSYSDVVRKQKNRSTTQDYRHNRPIMGPHRPRSRTMSRSKSYSKSRSRSKSRLRSKSRSPSPSRSRRRSRSRSFSRSSSSRSRSRSYSPYKRSRSRSRDKNRRSRSPANNAGSFLNRKDCRSMSFDSNDKTSQSAATVPRYYGRRAEDKSSSELSTDTDSSDSDDDTNKSAVGNKSTNQNQLRLSGSSSKGPSRETLTLKEKLKRKMQAQLTRQLRADKRAEAERLERESRRQARRDHEMRELAIRLRRKQREMRHQQNRRSSDDDSDKSDSRSSSRDSTQTEKKRECRTRSKSPSPKHTIVWEPNKEPSSYRSKYADSSDGSRYQDNPRRRYEDTDSHYRERRPVDDRPNKYERYHSRGSRNYDSYNRHENRTYDNRWEHDSRRPYGTRDGYRGSGSKYGDHPGDGHSSNTRNDPDNRDRENPEASSKRVKLVDY